MKATESKEIFLRLKRIIRLLRMNGSHNDIINGELNSLDAELRNLEWELADRIDVYMAESLRLHNLKLRK